MKIWLSEQLHCGMQNKIYFEIWALNAIYLQVVEVTMVEVDSIFARTEK